MENFDLSSITSILSSDVALGIPMVRMKGLEPPGYTRNL
jgi:hypothetical protein